MKYKVGDKIKIKDDLSLFKNYKILCVSYMLKFKGKKCVITKVIKEEWTGIIYYKIDIDDYGFSFTDDMFDLVDKQFTKDDLKPFYVVEFRNKQLAMVCINSDGNIILGNINNIQGKFIIGLYSYNDTLKHDIYSQWDIMKVYGNGNGNSRDILNVNIENRELLWERVEINPRIKEIEDEIKVKNDELSKLIDELNNLK